MWSFQLVCRTWTPSGGERQGISRPGSDHAWNSSFDSIVYRGLLCLSLFIFVYLCLLFIYLCLLIIYLCYLYLFIIHLSLFIIYLSLLFIYLCYLYLFIIYLSLFIFYLSLLFIFVYYIHLCLSFIYLCYLSLFCIIFTFVYYLFIFIYYLLLFIIYLSLFIFVYLGLRCLSFEEWLCWRAFSCLFSLSLIRPLWYEITIYWKVGWQCKPLWRVARWRYWVLMQ